MSIYDYGYTFEEHKDVARITAVHKERYAIVSDYGEGYAKLKASQYFTGYAEYPTVGDFVRIIYNASGDSRIVETLPRRTYFSRRDPQPGHGEQAVAANFDYVFILQSLNMDFNVKRLERYLTLAWQSGATPVVLLTKADLISDYSAQVLATGEIAVGASIHVVSAVTGQGLEGLKAYLQPGKTVVFLGSSGVGKSSLVNALAGREIMATGGIREDDSKGRHTTTHRQLIRLENGVMIIDTPGMRELGMWDVTEGLGDAFSDVERFIGRCRFRDCRHESEPGCAVKAAIASGELDAARFESYRSLKKEAEYADDKESYLRQKQQWHKEISKFSRQLKKERRK